MICTQHSTHSDNSSQYHCRKCGSVVPQLWQDTPVEFLPGKRDNQSWTDTVAGYLRKAKQLSYCMLHNDGKKYRYEVVVNFEDILCPSCHNTCCNQIARKLREGGVEAFLVREIDTNNLIHLNFTVSEGGDSVKECRRRFKKALPSRSDIACRVHVDEIDNPHNWCPYSCKAASKDGKDRWGDKRLLFQPKTGIQKTKTVGKFWSRPMRVIWKQHADEEKAIHQNLKREGMVRVVKDARSLVGDWFPFWKIKRLLGHFADSDTVTAWRNQMLETPFVPDEPIPYNTYTKVRRERAREGLFSTFQSGDTVRCDWLPGITAQLAPEVQTYEVVGGEVRSYPPKNGWTLHFATPSDSVLEGIPEPIRDRIVTTPDGFEMCFGGVTEDDIHLTATDAVSDALASFQGDESG